jgi:hypothetical protein
MPPRTATRSTRVELDWDGELTVLGLGAYLPQARREA